MHLVLKIIPKKWLITLALLVMGLFSFLLLGVVSIFIAAMGSDSGTDTGDITYTGEGQVMNVSPEVIKNGNLRFGSMQKLLAWNLLLL
ncbi:hypothetical protein ACO1DG_28910 [Bacillus thuringiensis]|uniref:hypothetical protein n=1 Tax=Bacillus thuringiensis TaxID=1428 RepID=UPI003BF76E70